MAKGILYNECRYICRILCVILIGIVYLTGCSDEDWTPQLSVADKVTMNIKVAGADMKDMNSRAGASDFDKIYDLNILVAAGNNSNDAITQCYFLDGMSSEDGLQLTENNGEYQIEGFEDKFAENSVIFVVGNYGNKIDISNINTVDKLKSLKDEGEELQGSWHIGKCLLFNIQFQGVPVSENMQIKLERTIAMLTVAINGKNLAPNVEIIPTEIRLCRVPKSCLLGKDNFFKENDDASLDNIGENGEYYTAADLGWDKNIQGTIVGEHYAELDYSNINIRPLFLYENIHGGEFGAENDDEKWKRPANASQEESDIDAKSKTCSYLEIKVKYYSHAGDGTINKGGTASYRVFLGSDVLKNFDIKRNSYYKFTLVLSGQGGEEESSWRIESDIQDDFIVTETDFKLNASGEFITIKIEDVFNVKQVNLMGKITERNFIYVFTSKQGGIEKGYWSDAVDVFGITSGSVHIPINSESSTQFVYLYVVPYVWDENKPITRSAEFTINEDNGSKVSAPITITQYKAIRMEITNNESDSPAMREAAQYAKNHLGIKENEFPLYLYTDRIDRLAKPWGFDETLLDFNHANGFENVYHLIDPRGGEDSGSNCSVHVEKAKVYLPLGTIGGTDGKGSCMMHAAFVNSYQWNQTQPVWHPDQLDGKPLPDRPSGSGDLIYDWSIPSIEEWQLLEKLYKANPDIFDGYPVLNWLPYWTSSTVSTQAALSNTWPSVSDGSSHSFTYQMGQGLDVLTADDKYPSDQVRLRTDAVRYRFVAVKPSVLE